MTINTNYDPFQERLYEMILILKDKDVSTWEKHFLKSAVDGIKLEKIGKLSNESVLCFNHTRWSVRELHTVWKNNWNTSFKGSLAEDS